MSHNEPVADGVERVLNDGPQSLNLSRAAIRSLWYRYALAIGLLVALLTGVHVAQNGAVEAAAYDAETINYSGRQRMLSQRVLYFATAYQKRGEAADRVALLGAVDEFEVVHRRLTGAPNISATIADMYFLDRGEPSLDAEVASFIAHAREVARSRSPRALTQLQQGGTNRLLSRLDAVDFAYQTEAKQRADRLRMIQRNALFVALFVLALECVLIFVPAQRRAGRALREIEGQSEELSKALAAAEAGVEAREVFLTKISHELRTPLNGVIGMTQVLRQTELTDTQRGMVKTVETAAGVLHNTILDVLNYTALNSGNQPMERRAFSLPDLVRTVNAALADDAQREGCEVVVDLDPLVRGVQRMGDPIWLREVLSKLLGNAMRFGDGEVRLEVQVDETRDEIVVFKISDRGPGMTPEAFARACRPFNQDEENPLLTDGVGLGLPIVDKAVSRMGGELSLDDARTTGACIVVRLPLPIARPGRDPYDPEEDLRAAS